MTRFRLVRTRCLLGVLFLLSLGFFPQRLPAQQEPSAAPSAESSAAPGTVPAGTANQGLGDAFGDTECHPPSTQEWVFIALGTLVVFVVCFLLLVRLIQRHYIRQDRNATLGRHLGISLTFLVSSLGMAGVAYLVTGCLHRQFLVWLCFPLALWLIHLIYTLAVVRNE
jgi:hypothetical protein